MTILKVRLLREWTELNGFFFMAKIITHYRTDLVKYIARFSSEIFDVSSMINFLIYALQLCGDKTIQ